MDDRIKLSYFYGKEAEQYSFYKIPKLLFTDDYFKKISVEAKVLYGLMLDRMSLSVKNQWMDEEGRAYIYYSLENIMDALGCSNKKAISIMKELDIDAGIGLIEKKRQGQGKPTMIYLKQFMIQDVQKCRNYTSEEKTDVSEVKNLHILKCKNDMSRNEESSCLEVKNIHTNKNNINNTELSNTESNLILSGDDRMRYEMDAYAELIRENIELDILRERYPYEQDLLDGIFDLILETVLCKNDTIIVASNRYPAELVRSKFLKLNSSHIEYAIDCFKGNTTKIRNIKKYLLTTLFNAPSTISGYYQAEVNHDYPQYAVVDK
jgi:phage protein